MQFHALKVILQNICMYAMSVRGTGEKNKTQLISTEFAQKNINWAKIEAR